MYRPAASAFLLALASATLLSIPASARTGADPKGEIARVLKRQLKGDFTPHSPAEIRAAIRPVDINRDGIQDWQVDFNAFGSAWCGTGGCRYQLWLGQKTGSPLRVFDRQVREHQSAERHGRIVFVFDFHGTQCGGFGAEACPGEFTWSPKRGRMVLLPTAGKRTSTTSPVLPFQ